MSEFNWLQLIPGVGHQYTHVATAMAVTAMIVLVSIAARLALGSGESAVAPAGRFSLKGTFELIAEGMVSLNDMVLGHEERAYIPLFGAIFVYICLSNMMGLIPGMTPSTDNFNTTFAVGLFAFVTYNFLGLKEHGPAYLKHFLGPALPWWLALFIVPIMLPIELISHMVRPMSLGLRLMGNMTGDHTVLGIFLELVPFTGIPLIFYVLGLFVCFVQAFVFTLLTMIYVLMATAHDH